MSPAYGSMSVSVFIKVLFERDFGGDHGTYHNNNLYDAKKSADRAHSNDVFSSCGEHDSYRDQQNEQTAYFPKSADVLVGKLPRFLVFHRHGGSIPKYSVDFLGRIFLKA